MSDKQIRRPDGTYAGAVTHENIMAIFDGAGDFNLRKLHVGGHTIYIYAIDGLTSGGDISEYVVKPLMQDSVEGSLLYALANLFAWLFRPLGFGSPACVAALIAGLLAKENILSALSVTSAASAFTLPSALAFVTFSALYAPCAAACAVLRRELNSRGRMLLAVLSQTGAAWLAAFIVYRITLLVCR